MELLEKLELKLTDIYNKRDRTPDFSYVGQKYHILERVGVLIIATVVRRERDKIQRYIQDNYTKELDIDKLTEDCMHNIFNVKDEFVVYEGIEYVEHEFYLPDFERKFKEQVDLVFKNINNKTLKLEL
jgi:hypothetical protein